MAYSVEKDKELAEFNVGDIHVTLHSYNSREPKVQISRAYVDKLGETQYTKSGRLTKEEWEDVCKLKDEVLAEIKKWDDDAKIEEAKHPEKTPKRAKK
jgi:hypothetical protein